MFYSIYCVTTCGSILRGLLGLPVHCGFCTFSQSVQFSCILGTSVCLLDISCHFVWHSIHSRHQLRVAVTMAASVFPVTGHLACGYLLDLDLSARASSPSCHDNYLSLTSHLLFCVSPSLSLSRSWIASHCMAVSNALDKVRFV